MNGDLPQSPLVGLKRPKTDRNPASEAVLNGAGFLMPGGPDQARGRRVGEGGFERV